MHFQPPPAAIIAPGADPMDRAAAVASRVVLLRGVLSDAEILQLDALYARIRAEEA